MMTAIGSSRLDAPTLTILAFIPAVGMRDLRELILFCSLKRNCEQNEY